VKALGDGFFRQPLRVESGLRNAWLVNLWRMRRVAEDGVTVDYFVRRGHVVITRIRMALET